MDAIVFVGGGLLRHPLISGSHLMRELRRTPGLVVETLPSCLSEIHLAAAVASASDAQAVLFIDACVCRAAVARLAESRGGPLGYLQVMDPRPVGDLVDMVRRSAFEMTRADF